MWPQRLVRTLAVLAALVLVAGLSPHEVAADCCPAHATLERQDEGCHDGCSKSAERNVPAEDDHGCPCPLPCAPGCRGHAPAAIPVAALTDLPRLMSEVTTPTMRADRGPPSPDPGDILHVPKSVRS